MKLYQHVYGRVSKGYRGGLQGYQLAALSDELSDRVDLIERLNRFSFFNLRDGTGAEERFSFYRPAAGFLAFGCSRLARDRTGSTGWFAHHYVCDESDFLNHDISPPRVLQRLSWLKNEKELPPDRSLAVVKLPLDDSLAEQDAEDDASGRASARWRPFALQVLDLLLGKPLPVVPLVIATDEEAGQILSELFYLTPRQEAALLSFSTLFAEATEFIEAFRLVFVPDEKHVSSGTYVYRVVRAGETFKPVPPPLVLTTLWREHGETAPSLVRFVNLLRQGPAHQDEAAALLPSLLALGKAFHDCVESFRLKGIYDLVLRNEEWLVAYARAGADLRYSDLSRALWDDLDRHLIPLLRASSQLRSAQLAESALKDLSARLIAGHVNTTIIARLEEAGFLQMFFQTAGATLRPVELIGLIEKLKDEAAYRHQLHRMLASLLLTQIVGAEAREWVEPLRWLSNEREARAADNFVNAAVGFGVHVANRSVQEFRASDYRLDLKDYGSLVEWVWAYGINRIQTHKLLDMVVCREYVGELLRVISLKLPRYETDTQKSILNVIATKFSKAVAANRSLLDAIDRAEDAANVAESFRRQLMKAHPDISDDELRELRSIVKRRKRRFFDFR